MIHAETEDTSLLSLWNNNTKKRCKSKTKIELITMTQSLTPLKELTHGFIQTKTWC